jgi:DNA polymerase-1
MNSAKRPIGWDLETTCIDFMAEDAAILTAAWWEDSMNNDSFLWDWPGIAPCWRVRRDALTRLMIDREVVLVGHNLVGFDLPWWIYKAGTPIVADIFDTQVAKSLLDETGKGNTLLDLTKEYLPFFTHLPEMEKMKRQRGNLIEMDKEEVMRYNLIDAQASLLLYEPMKADLEAAGSWDIFQLMMQVGPALSDMMVRGMNVDRAWVARQAVAIAQERDGKLDRFHEITDHLVEEPVNPKSPVQLTKFLFETLGMPTEFAQATKTGKPSTGVASLKALRSKAKHKVVRELLDVILDYRAAEKLLGTYLEPLVGKHLDPDGKVRTQYHLGKTHMGGTVTGRLSSSKPNLQNIPRDPRVKGALVPRAGWRLFDADFAQLELRVAAWYANEDSMLEAFHSGQDVHTVTLAQMKGVSYEDASERVETGEWKDERALIKPVNFGILYGVSAYTLVEIARDLGLEISLRKAQTTIDNWFKIRPNIEGWIRAQERRIIQSGEIRTPTGRTRHLPGASKMTPFGRGQLRQGVNFMVQSLASDINLAALEAVHSDTDPSVNVLLTVHDSIVGEYDPQAHDEEAIRYWLHDRMVNAVQHQLTRWGIEGVPLDIDVQTNQLRWGG